MSEPYTPAEAFCSLADCEDIGDNPGWINRVRSAVRLNGEALRAGPDLSIQAKSLVTNLWQPIMTPRNGTQFVSAVDRDEALRRIVG